METTTFPVVEITIKTEPMESENVEENEQNTQVKEEELWIKTEPLEDESQDFIKEEDHGTLSENEARLDEETLHDDCYKKETNDLKSTLPLKKRLEERVKLEDDDFPKKEKSEEKNVTEEDEQQVDNSQPKTETPLMYSYETLRNVEIVTINEEERQKEYEETLRSRQHMRHVCVHCALGFVLKQAFDVHMKVHSPQSGDHECLLCHSRLKTADMLYRHRLRHYRRYRCLLCRTRFKDKDTAACHVMNDHAGQTFECDQCGRGFKRPQYLKRHVEQHHTKPHHLECGVCFRVFHERGWYRSHIRTHNEEVRAKTVRLPVTCEICSRDYKNKASLKRHLLTHDENVHCEICYEKCKNRITLGHHYLKVHNEKYVGFHAMMGKNTDDSHEERKRKRQINNSSDDGKIEEERKRKNREKCKRYRQKKKVAPPRIRGSSDSVDKKREEERKRKNRENAKRFREKKKNTAPAVTISLPLNSEEKKREEERKQKNREKTRRYREKKKNEIEVAALSMATADSSSDSSGTKMKQAKQKIINAEKCKRYRDKKRKSNLQNISNPKNVPQQIYSSQIASPSTREVPNVPPVIHTSQIAGPSSRDVPYIPPSHSNNNSPILSIEDRVL